MAERAAEEICQKNIILFDEIDRTHKNTHESFLNFIENGKMTTGRTKTYSFPKRSIIFMTRNLNVDYFVNKEDCNEKNKKAVNTDKDIIIKSFRTWYK